MSDDLTIPSPAYRPPRRERPGLAPETKRRIMIAGGLAGGLAVVAGLTSLIGGRQGHDVPVVQADDRPLRVKPDNPGGLQVAGANNEIFNESSGNTARLAPAPEAPNPAALRAAQPQPVPPPEAAPKPPAAAHTTPSPAGPTSVQTAPAARTTGKPEPAPKGTSATHAKPDTAAKPDAAKPPAMAHAGPAQGTSPQHTAAQAGHQGTAAQTTNQPTASPSSAAPTTQMAPQTASAPSNAARTAATAAPTGAEKRPAGAKITVQLAAVGSEDAAKTEWRTLAKRLPDLLGGRQPVYARTERDGKAFWRVRTGGFADVAEARGFCERVRAKGAACTVAEF